MTPTTEGFALEGLARQLMPDMMGLVGTIVVVLILFWIAHSLVSRSLAAATMDSEDARTARVTINWVAGLIIALSSVGFFWHAASVTTINRMPRAELDATSIYDQMNANIEKR